MLNTQYRGKCRLQISSVSHALMSTSALIKILAPGALKSIKAAIVERIYVVVCDCARLFFSICANLVILVEIR